MNTTARFILFLGSLLIAPLFSIAQADFAPIGAKWYYEWYGHAYNPVTSIATEVRGYMLQESVADTPIHGITARKLQQTVFARSTTDNSIHSAPYGNMYIYATNDTIWYYNRSLDRFLLLYAFNVQVGDTLKHRAPPELANSSDTTWKMIVNAVTTENYNGQTVKSVHVNVPIGMQDGEMLKGPYYQYFGQTEGRMGEYAWSYLEEEDYDEFTLRCYQDATFDVHFGNVAIACDSIKMLPTAVADVHNLSGKLSVYPNPSTGQMHIVLDGIDIQSVEVLDILGRKVMLQQQSNGNAPVQLQLDGFSKGTYILRITTKDKGSVHRKIVLQ